MRHNPKRIEATGPAARPEVPSTNSLRRHLCRRSGYGISCHRQGFVPAVEQRRRHLPSLPSRCRSGPRGHGRDQATGAGVGCVAAEDHGARLIARRGVRRKLSSARRQVQRFGVAASPRVTAPAHPYYCALPPNCPRCGSTGTYPILGTNAAGGQRWECMECGKNFFYKGPKVV